MWPTNAIPEHVVTRLFAKMLDLYGAKFSRMWADSDAASMKRTWAIALYRVKPDDFRRGMGRLFHTKDAPTLPEFLALCQQPDALPYAAGPALTDEATPTPREQARELTTALRTLTTKLTARSHASIDWARKILERDDVTPWQIEQASDAIRLWETIHHVAVERVGQDDDEPLELRRIPSPHIYAADVDGETLSRVPGEDDEPFIDPITHPEGETQS